MSRWSRLFPVLFGFAFTLVAFVFSLLAITSPEWALRDYYDSPNGQSWVHPNWTMTRSPFGACAVIPKFNITYDADGVVELNRTFAGYNHTCSKYQPNGVGKTSCELQSSLITNNTEIIGDQRVCQQIHYAGNFGISSTVFVSVGFITVMFLTLFSILKPETQRERLTSRDSQHKSLSAGRETIEEVSPASPEDRKMKRLHHHHLIPNFNFVAITSLCLGAVLGLISQFYAVLGFIQSSPNNADFASSSAGPSQALDTNTQGYHGPWYQGSALSVYITCSWGFALAAAVVASKTWVSPRWLASA